ISNPAAPSHIGDYVTTSGQLNNLAVSGNFAYLATGEGGLEIVDVSNPGSPALAARAVSFGVAKDVVVSGHIAYVACGNGGLQIYDVSSPVSPILLSTFD